MTDATIISEDYIDVGEETADGHDPHMSPLKCRSQPHPALTPERRIPTPEGSSTSHPSPEEAGQSTTGDDENPSNAQDDTPDNSRARKGRTIYKAQQVYVLEQVFSRTHYPDPEVIETLARDLDISENKIKVSEQCLYTLAICYIQ